MSFTTYDLYVAYLVWLRYIRGILVDLSTKQVHAVRGLKFSKNWGRTFMQHREHNSFRNFKPSQKYCHIFMRYRINVKGTSRERECLGNADISITCQFSDWRKIYYASIDFFVHCQGNHDSHQGPSSGSWWLLMSQTSFIFCIHLEPQLERSFQRLRQKIFLLVQKHSIFCDNTKYYVI